MSVAPHRCNGRGPDHEETDHRGTTHHPIVTPLGHRRVGLDTPDPFALHLDCGTWWASCTGCGYELAEGRRQDKVEGKARTRSCPICDDFRGGNAA